MSLSPDAGMAELAARLGSGAGVEAGVGVDVFVRLAASLDSCTAELRRQRAHREWAKVHPAPVRPMAGQPAGGVLAALTDADGWGPTEGWAWDLRSFSVDGLVAGGGTPQQASGGPVLSPGSHVTIAQIGAANILPGTYLVQWQVELDGGVPAAADVDNFQLLFAGGAVLLTSVNDGVVGKYAQEPVQVTIGPGSAALIIRTAAAGTAGVSYSAQMTLIPVPDDQVTLYKGPVQPVNRLHTFTAALGPGPGPDWAPAKGAYILLPQDNLYLAGSGLAAAAITAWGQVTEVALDALPAYLS